MLNSNQTRLINELSKYIMLELTELGCDIEHMAYCFTPVNLSINQLRQIDNIMLNAMIAVAKHAPKEKLL